MRESQCARLARAGQGRATSPSKSDANCCSPETSSCRRLLFLQSRIGKINPFLDTRLFKISVASGVRKHTGYGLRERRAFACALETYVSARVPLERLEVAQ